MVNGGGWGSLKFWRIYVEVVLLKRDIRRHFYVTSTKNLYRLFDNVSYPPL